MFLTKPGPAERREFFGPQSKTALTASKKCFFYFWFFEKVSRKMMKTGPGFGKSSVRTFFWTREVPTETSLLQGGIWRHLSMASRNRILDPQKLRMYATFFASRFSRSCAPAHDALFVRCLRFAHSCGSAWVPGRREPKVHHAVFGSLSDTCAVARERLRSASAHVQAFVPLHVGRLAAEASWQPSGLALVRTCT